MSRNLDLSAREAVVPQAAAASVARGCLLCGGTSFAPLFGAVVPRPVPDAAAKPYRITHSSRVLTGAILRCRNCGLGVLPEDKRDDAHRLYGEGEDDSYLLQAEQRIRNAERLLRLVPAGGRLLEVGSACGFLLVAARRLGFEARGVELSAWAAQYARQHFQCDVWQGSIENAPLDPESVDVAVLADVIEHLPDPRATLALLHRVLVPGGRILVLTPDLGSLFARLAGRHWWGLLDDHYYYFDRCTLPRLLDGEGFATERLVSFGREFQLRHWVYKISQYHDGLHRCLAAVLRALRVDGVHLPMNLGDQMACVARKKVP